MIGVLKEYLVKLGYDVDIPSYDKFMSTIDMADAGIANFGGVSKATFASAGAAVTAFVGTANMAMLSFISSVAKADMETAKFARRMWMTKENARALKNVLGVLDEEMEDIALNAELRQQFFQLRKEAFALNTPSDYNNQMVEIRSMIFEFKRLKLEATYAAQWIGYYLYKYVKEPLTGIKNTLKGANDYISTSMPVWTKNIAQVFSWVLRLGIAFARTGVQVVDVVRKLPKEFKIAAIAIAGLWSIVKANPFTLVMLAIASMLLMLDDFYTYIDGGEAKFKGLWEWMVGLYDKLEDTGAIEDFTNALSDMWDNTKDISKSIKNILDELSKLVGFEGFGDLMENNFIKSFQALNTVLEGVAGSLQAINDLLTGDWGSFIENLSKGGDNMRKGILKMFFGEDLGEDMNNFFRSVFNWGGIANQIPAGSQDYSMNEELLKALNGRQVPNYLQSYPMLPNIVNNEVKPTFNNYGSDPYLTSTNTMRQMEGLLLRNLQGVNR